MDNPELVMCRHESVQAAIESLTRGGYLGLCGISFAAELEDRFESDTKKARSQRLWLEGLLAIVVFNVCLLVDHVLVHHDAVWDSVVRRTMVVTPLALLVNVMMRANPPRWMREGSVAAGTVMICFVNLYAQTNDGATSTLFAVMCLLITVFFAGVVMRLRFLYAAGSILTMLAGGLVFLTHAKGLDLQEMTLGASMMVICVTITLMASYGLEKQERMSYLQCLRSDLQGEDLARMNAELHTLSTLDKLTGLPNRRALEDRFERMWAEGIKSGRAMSAIVIDVDHFKVINDVYGHLYGDEALRRIAALLPRALRGVEDFVGRFGGEEFVLLLPNAERDVALAVAERARVLVEAAGTPIPEQTSGETMLWATVSCGVSLCVPNAKARPEMLLEAADKALYAAKHGGRNRVEFAVCEAAYAKADDGRRAGDGRGVGRASGIRRVTEFVKRGESGVRGSVAAG